MMMMMKTTWIRVKKKWRTIFNIMKKKSANKMEILVGCDPELFVTNNEGRPRGAYGLIQGTKESPFKVAKGAYQVDGMALEFNIEPAANENEFVENISTVMQRLRADVPSEFKFLIKPSVRFHHAILKAAPEEAKELGCQPDFSAYTLKENPKPNAETTLRTASGHIHIGFTKDADVSSEEHMVRCATLVKHLDLFLGIRSLEWDKDKTRRQLYGNPGAMRIKPYGVEYRVLSNMWLDREELVRFVYRQTLRCIEDLRTNGALTEKDYEYIANDVKDGCRQYTKQIIWAMSAKGKAAIAQADKLKIGE
jgi:hypothetical protein